IRTTLEPVDFMGTNSSSLGKPAASALLSEILIPQSGRGIHIIFYEPQSSRRIVSTPDGRSCHCLAHRQGLYGSLAPLRDFRKSGSRRLRSCSHGEVLQRAADFTPI